MKPKPIANPKIFLLVLFALILFFSFLTYWRFREFQKSLSKIEPPKFEMPKTEALFTPPKIEEKEFIGPDGKLSLKYPSDWLKMEEKSLEIFNKQMVVKGANVLLFAQKIKGFSIGFLIVQEIGLEKDKKLEELIEEIKKGGREGQLEITNLKIEDKEATFEADYQRKDFPGFHSKERILKEENKAYLIGVAAFSQNWAEFEVEANQILGSTQILNK